MAYPGLDGVQRLYAYEPLVGEGSPSSFVFIGIPNMVAYAQANRMLAINLLGLGVVTALALAAAWFGGYYFIIRPDGQTLLRATQRLEGRDLNARVGLPDGSGEFHQLGQAFDQMATAIQTHQDEILQANLSLRRANRALSVLSACNHTLVHAEDETEFLAEICRIIHKVGGYPMAWVGFAVNNDHQSIRPVAQAGCQDEL